jgi:hypothetical protein
MGRLVHSLGLQWPVESRIEDEVAAPAKKETVAAAPKAAEPAPAPAPQAIEPAKAAPAAEPVKQAVPAPAPAAAKPSSDITPDGFIKADKDGFIRSR